MAYDDQYNTYLFSQNFSITKLQDQMQLSFICDVFNLIQLVKYNFKKI